MSETDSILLTDRNIYPTDDYIFSIIGEKKVLWQKIMSHMSVSYKDSDGQWNFYNDGKRWLFKMVYKKKTVFWATILEGTFKVTFYFSKKADTLIENSDLPLKIKEEFKTAKSYGLIRPISFVVKDSTDVDNVFKLAEIKSKLK